MPEATIIILNAHAITLNPKQPTAEAIAICNKKITAIGSNKEIRKSTGKETRIINAEGKTVVPGLVDCHVHMTGFGHLLQTLELRSVTSLKELQQKLRKHAKEANKKSWILGGRWDQELFSEKRYPTRWDLDAAVPDKPVFLTRVCGHVGVANSKALQMAGITYKTVVEGGKIDLEEATRKPNGILRENALELVWKAIPKQTAQEIEQTCLLACEKAAENGLTCVHWILGSADEMRAIQKIYSMDKLPVRVYLGIPVETLDELVNLGLLTGFGDDMVKIGFVKILADGSLGGHTAALKEPYSDHPETDGMILYTQEELDKLVLKAHKAGLQLAIHAIGDRTMEAVLKAYEKALKEHPKQNHRHRIEHCSVLNLKLVRRIKSLGIIASVQPHFVVSDFWITARVGKTRVRWTYPFKTLIREGIIVASGSDCPVESINPILGIWASVTRKTSSEERLTAEEALKTYTVNAAYASFDENKKGTIEVGKLADLTILSDDLLTGPPQNIRNITIEMTIVNGRIVYERAN